MKYFLFLTLAMILSVQSFAQKDIQLEDIWKNEKFTAKEVPGFNFLKDGRHYTRLENNVIKKYDITTGDYVEDIFNAAIVIGQKGFDSKMDGFEFNSDESKILIESETESIYRRSYLAKYHVYDLNTKEFHALYEDGKVMNATFSPDASKVAYVFDNNIYYYDLSDEITLPVTDDGEINKLINGIADWVYEEEFTIVKAFWWSPDSKKIAYLKFDESQVPNFIMTLHKDDVYPEYQTFKYPKVGQKNSDVSAHLYNMGTETSKPLDLGDMTEMYIPRVKWTQNSDEVCMFKLNRHQNHLQLHLVDTKANTTSVILDEKNKYYIDITDDLTFLNDGKHFIWTSEKEGFNHIYKYDMMGKEVAALTKGNYDVTAFYGIDESRDIIYYQSAEESPLQRHVYSIKSNGKRKRKLSKESGWNSAKFSSTYDYHILTHSDRQTANSYVVKDRVGKTVRVIEDNKAFNNSIDDYELSPVEFFSFETSEGVDLNGYIIKPREFDATKKYPVFMVQYSDPGSQQVVDRWGGANLIWYQMLSQQGYLVACVDPRGTGARGEEFKKMTYLQLGKYETEDQIEAAKYLGGLPYTDANRVGIFGWSYGGYMSSLCILKGNDVFSSAIAVAPVTNWKWYDSVYTERYMQTEEENASGYADNSPVYFADQLKGNYLLVHGGGDDNVHLQNSMEMANALIAANKHYDTYIYPNRAHGIRGDNARLHLFTKMTNFLNENLKNGPGLDGIVRP